MININGAKNSILPLIASTILSKNRYKFNNCIINTDIQSQLDILSQFSCSYNFDLSNKILSIDTTNLSLPESIDFSRSARANYYYIGSSINYNNNLKFLISNGCKIDDRKIDFHLQLLKLLNVRFKFEDDYLYLNNNNIIQNCNLNVNLPKPSVGATLNALLMFSKGNNILTIKNYAKDPYIIDQIKFLQKLGAKITINNEYINVIGTELNTNEEIVFDIMPDPIEAITYIIFTALCLKKNNKQTSNFAIGPINIYDLGKSNDLFEEIGINLIPSPTDYNYFYIEIQNKLKSFNMFTDYFPGIYTDSQPFFTLLACFIDGVSSIEEKVYNERFGYISDFQKYNLDIEHKQKNLIQISGSNNNFYQKLNQLSDNQTICLKDLRSGMSTYLLNYILDNPYILKNTFYIDRGYYDYENKSLIIKNNLNIMTNFSTTELSNIKIGGYSKFFTEAKDTKDIHNSILFAIDNKCKFKIIGFGTNICFSDYYNGLIIKNVIDKKNVVKNNNQVTITIGSGNSLQELVDLATMNKVDVHQLSDIPGSVGGAIYGNAGAYGMEIKDILSSVMVYDIDTLQFKNIESQELNLCYRNSAIKNNNKKYIIIEATFIFNISDLAIETIFEKNKKISDIRRSKMPYNNTLGCIFKNPDTDLKAGKLLDSLNIKGLNIGKNIFVSNNHSNIWITQGQSSAADLTDCINDIRKKIKLKYNVDLQIEMEII